MMNERDKSCTKSGFILLSTLAFVFLSSPSLSNGIDWGGVLLDDGSNDTFNNRSRPRSNLPGVRTIPSSSQNAQRNACNNGLSGSSQSGNSSVSSDGCNSKTPLIVVRDGQVGGLLFDFAR